MQHRYFCCFLLKPLFNLADSNPDLPTFEQVALELVDAILGKGKEYFGFDSNTLQINAPPVWMPYTVFDRLIMELEANSNDSTYISVNAYYFYILHFLNIN